MINWEYFIKSADLTDNLKSALICKYYSSGMIDCKLASDDICPLKGFCTENKKVKEWLEGEVEE